MILCTVLEGFIHIKILSGIHGYVKLPKIQRVVLEKGGGGQGGVNIFTYILCETDFSS